MTPQRTLGAVALAGALVIAACAGGSDDAAAPITEAPSATTDEVATDPPPTAAPTTEAPPSAEPVTYEQLAARAIDGDVDELTLVLSEFAALFGVDVPGAVPLAVDPSLPTLGTDVLLGVRRLDDQLTEEQRSIINARLDEVLAGEVVYNTRDDAEYQALFDGTAGDDVTTTEPQGFGLIRPARIDEGMMNLTARQAAITYAGSLGGPGLSMDVRAAPASAAEVTTLDAVTEFFKDDGDRQCIITVYDRERNREGHLVSVLAHEVFHCWQFTNASSDTAITGFHGFYLEGLATWVGEQFAAGVGFDSGSDFGWGHLRGFFNRTDYPLFDASYTAYGFWSQVVKLRGGPDELWSIIPELNTAAADRAAVFDLALGGVEDIRRAELAASAVRRPDWSPAWDFTALGIPVDARSIQDRTTRPGTRVEKQVSEGQQAIVRFDLAELTADTNWIITRVNAGLTYNRLGDFDEYATTASEQTRFCYGEACVCSDGSSPFPDLLALPRTVTSLTVALTGSSSAGASVSVDAADVEDFCEEEPPVEPPPLASGAFNGNGAWRATNEALGFMFADASAFGFGAEELDIAGVTGDVVMELREDGTGTLTYTNVTAFFNGGPLTDLTINGKGDFSFGVGGGVLTVSGNTFTVSATSSALFGEELVITDRDIEGGAGGTSTYTIGFDGDNRLILADSEGSRGAVFFPVVWTRV